MITSIGILGLHLLVSTFPIILDIPPRQWVCRAHAVPSIYRKYSVRISWISEWVSQSLSTCSHTLVTREWLMGTYLVVLTFTSAKEIFFFLSTGAVKPNLYLLGSLPGRRHKRVLHPIDEGIIKVKDTKTSWSHGLPQLGQWATWQVLCGPTRCLTAKH